MNYKSIIHDTSWGAFIISPAPVAISGRVADGKLSLRRPNGECAASQLNVVERDDDKDEVSMQLTPETGDRFVETLAFLRDNNITSRVGMDGDIDLGTWYEFSGEDESNVYVMMFVHNIAEYQARQVAEGMQFKYWFTPRGYNEGKDHYPIDMSEALFLDKSSPYASGNSPDASSEWAKRNMLNTPGMACINVGTRLMSSAFRKHRMGPSATDSEVTKAAANYMSRGAAGGFTFLEMLQQVDPTITHAQLNFAFLLPLKREV